MKKERIKNILLAEKSKNISLILSTQAGIESETQLATIQGRELFVEDDDHLYFEYWFQAVLLPLVLEIAA